MTAPTLSDAERAAVMVMLLDESKAATILGRLDPQELQVLGEKMCALGEIGPVAIAQAIAGFVEKTERLGLIAHGINVNAIAPGYMDTNNTEAIRADAQRNAEILGRIPAGRWGLPEDMAGPIVFLASPASNYLQGHTMAVDGGWLAR